MDLQILLDKIFEEKFLEWQRLESEGWTQEQLEARDENIFGVKKAWREYEKSFHSMREERAIAIYRVCFFKDHKYNDLEDQQLGEKVFRVSLNIGCPAAFRLLQHATNKCLEKMGERPVYVDGHFDKNTVDQLNKCDPREVERLFTELTVVYYRTLPVLRERPEEMLNEWIDQLHSM